MESELEFWPELSLAVDDDDIFRAASAKSGDLGEPEEFGLFPALDAIRATAFSEDYALPNHALFPSTPPASSYSPPSWHSPESSPPSSPDSAPFAALGRHYSPVQLASSSQDFCASSSSSSPSLSPAKPARKRPRRPVCNTVPEAETVVTASREQILTWSSQEMDDFVAMTRARIGRDFTQAEEKEIKRQKRLIKNRESALASRLRKKAEMDQLVTQKDRLMQKLDDLQAKDERIRQLEKENALLRVEVTELRAIVASNPELSSPFLSGVSRLADVTSSSLSSLSHGIKKSLSVGDDKPVHIKSEPRSSVFVLIVLFSFALFFSVPFAPVSRAGVKFPNSTVLLPRSDVEPLPHVDRSAAAAAAPSFPPLATMRKPLGLGDFERVAFPAGNNSHDRLAVDDAAAAQPFDIDGQASIVKSLLGNLTSSPLAIATAPASLDSHIMKRRAATS